ncbi:major facilitator superfamily permease [Yersinia enterocolitica]|uniref:DUF1435 domain-containing protein n=1 Tax=Yersinia enterocolitica TaxID=630 RepID=UPI0002819AA7|nr:DUF1435 domain-containing protein [Yersinia enterocolitica]VTP88045.1 major facilitator superfamily permease [Yersinia enterocolitica subsp. enterocolitica]AJI83252.1 hypothetical protein CH47_2918 [Yersinia enterocolitica]AJJ22840.1 hypothetical protein CH49_4252 [Yersinia enterocolitica]EKA29185.1 hypothetical protein YWA314_00224 [Yersinia enterocolitica subsp. enterocolitica WA-314]ELI8283330.1 DUF1435 domain-containing protein [Yersinia enterocolitica]
MITARFSAYRLWGISGLLSRGMSSGWGMLLPFTLLPVLGWADITVGQLRVLIVVAMLATVSMLYHARLRHFLLLPSCLALLAGMVAVLMHY